MRWQAQIDVDLLPRKGWRRFWRPRAARTARAIKTGRLRGLGDFDYVALNRRVAAARRLMAWLDGQFPLDELERRIKRREKWENRRWILFLSVLFVVMPAIGGIMHLAHAENGGGGLVLIALFGFAVAVMGGWFIRTIGLAFFALAVWAAVMIYLK